MATKEGNEARPVEDFERLKRIRGGNRAVITKLEKEADAIIRGVKENEINITKDVSKKIGNIMRQLKEKQSYIQQLNERILGICAIEEIDKEIVDSAEEKYRSEEILDELQVLISKEPTPDRELNAMSLEISDRQSTEAQNPNQEEEIRSSTPTRLETSNNSGSSRSSTGIRLPKLNLVKFNGDVTRFQAFWQSFSCSVDQNEELSDIHKLNYLLNSLEGAAYKALQALDILDSNYGHAKDILKSRFGNTQEIISTHMPALLNLRCKPTNKVVHLRELYDTLNAQIRGLESLGITSKEYGSLLIPVIMNRMPSEIALQVARKTQEDVWDIKETLKIVQREIEAREMSNSLNSFNDNQKKPEKTNSMPSGTTQAFVTSEKPKLECFFCRKDHYASECNEVKNIEERKNILKKSKQCFVCLKLGHGAWNCKSSLRCKICKRKQNTVICAAEKDKEKEVKMDKEESPSAVMAAKVKSDVLLQTARAFVYGDDKSKGMEVNVLFDGGSQRSYVNEKIREKLGVKGKKRETINLNTFGNDKHAKQVCEVCDINVEVEGGTVPIRVLSFPTICSPIATSIQVSDYPHLGGLSLADSFDRSDKEIGILIGANFYHDFVTGDVIRGGSGPVALASKLGWILSGPVSYETETHTCASVISNLAIDILPSRTDIIDEKKEILESLDTFWKHESCGLIEEETGVRSQEGENDKIGETKIRFNETDSRYQVSLPFKGELKNLNLDSHYDLCKSRLYSLHSHLKKDQVLLKEYDAVFQDQLKKGIIEIVPKDQEKESSDCHFLCHHGVVKRDRLTTKLRVVFDGSAKGKNCQNSLNDILEIGNNYMPLLFDTLVRFRIKPIALTADIQQAFLQIQIDQADKDMLRFLWFDDVSKPNPEIIQLRHNRLVFGLTSSPSILGETIRLHVAKHENEYPEVSKILKRLYADDLSCGADTKEEAIQIYREAKEIMLKGSFNLRKWQCNDKEVLREIDSLEKQHQVSEIPQVSENHAKVLGVSWNHLKDMLFYDQRGVIDFAQTLKPTKRSVLQLAAKIFDPLGALSALTINLKILFQDLCINKVSWDEELKGVYRDKFVSLISELEKFHGLEIPRCLFEQGEAINRVEIHGFSDASEKAQRCVVYLRILYASGRVDIRFLAGKAKVNSIKNQTIPRLELCGAVLLSKLVGTIKPILEEELSLASIDTYYWIDSISALCWIKNGKSWTPYIRNRVTEILKRSDGEQWFYCPGLQNPADIPSRGLYNKCVAPNTIWWEGPEFLKSESTQWPQNPNDSEQEVSKAMKEKRDLNFIHSMVTSDKTGLEEIIDLNRVSNKNKLLRTIAWILRFIHNARNKGNRKQEAQVSTEEVENAEKLIIRSVQQNAFYKEIDYLKCLKADRNKGKYTGKVPLNVSQFNLFLDDEQLLRCSSRIKNANVSDSMKVPLLLPAKHYFSELVVKDCHWKVMHNGAVDTLNSVREKYWVIRGREMAKKLIRRCVICKKVEGLPFRTKFNPNLPRFRVDDGPPFSQVGIDFAGPLVIEDRERSKCYVCLFTCAATRAVHLELVESLHIETFIKAFRRFCARRGVPNMVISDNAKTYKSAAKEVRNLFRSPRLREHMTSNGVKWKFIVELSPWQGGMWERLIRSVKRCLVKVIGRALLKYDELNTILIEVESVINSRPLTYLTDDEEGVAYPLTPSQLINGRNLQCLPSEQFYEVVSTYESLSKRGKYHRRLLSQFATRWKKEYLSSLLQAYRPREPIDKRQVKIGDVVILKDSQTKRVFWKLARVVELMPGNDGIIRSARIQVIQGDGKSFLNRSLKLLIPLEISDCSAKVAASSANANGPAVSDVVQTHSPTAQTQAPTAQTQAPTAQTQRMVITRNRRNAAVIGEILRKDKLSY